MGSGQGARDGFNGRSDESCEEHTCTLCVRGEHGRKRNRCWGLGRDGMRDPDIPVCVCACVCMLGLGPCCDAGSGLQSATAVPVLEPAPLLAFALPAHFASQVNFTITLTAKRPHRPLEVFRSPSAAEGQEGAGSTPSAGAAGQQQEQGQQAGQGGGANATKAEAEPVVGSELSASTDVSLRVISGAWRDVVSVAGWLSLCANMLVHRRVLATRVCKPYYLCHLYAIPPLPFMRHVAHLTTPHRTTPHRTAPHRTAPHRTAPHHTTPRHTTPHHTTPHHHATPRHTLNRPLASSRCRPAPSTTSGCGSGTMTATGRAGCASRTCGWCGCGPTAG